MRKHGKRTTYLMPLIALVGALLLVLSTQAQSLSGQTLPRTAGPVSTPLDTPVSLDADPRALTRVDPAVAAAEGRMNVIVRLSANTTGRAPSNTLRAQQDAVVSEIMALDANARVIGRAEVLMNALFVDIDAGKTIDALSKNPNILAIRPVGEYQLDLTETVPYIGATAVQDMGYDGAGVIVAVLDSGVDYTHANFGGPGTVEAYTAAHGGIPASPLNTTRDGLFPTAKVIEGYDFVGEAWPNGPVAFDDDPIDYQGHGSHVADIIGGVNGVAPGASLLAVKVCSAVSSSCNGAALILGMEFAVLNDADIINMSLGSNYGQPFDDDLSFAVEQASDMGVLTVASAGNSGNNQYSTGSPAAAPSALSVAQTAVPSAKLDLMQVAGGSNWVAVFQGWSAPLTSAISAPSQYGDGAGGNLNGCAAFAPGSLAGKIVLVDRGACAFSIKISNVAGGGGLVGVIGLVDGSEPFNGAFGGGTPTVPGFMVSLAAANDVRANLGGTVTFDPDVAVPLVGTMASSSARGPSNAGVYTGLFNNAADNNMVKPEIGAPGASVSAQVGTGTGETAFGGTSGAAPMVSGSAALLIDKYSWLRPDQVKALLMTNAETEIYTTATALGGSLAPLSRIGGGEVRVDRAATNPILAYSEDFTGSSIISIGQVDVYRRMTISKRIVVENLSTRPVTLDLTTVFRDPAKDNGALTVRMPSRVTVPGYQARVVNVRFILDPEFLPDWTMNLGAGGGGAATLDPMEFDGYILMDNRATSDDDADPAHVGFHVLPRKSGRVMVQNTHLNPNREFLGIPADKTRTRNYGYGDTDVIAYSLLLQSPNIPEGVEGAQFPQPDLNEVGYTSFLSGSCAAGWGYEFAVSSWERQAHEFPGNWSIFIDTNNDGIDDYEVFTYDLALSGTLTGSNVTWVANLATGAANAFFYTTSPTNYNVYIMTICGEQLGFADTSAAGQPMGATAAAWDAYFTGIYTDIADAGTISPLGERYVTVFGDTTSYSTAVTLADGERVDTWTLDFGPASVSTDIGAMLIYLDGAPVGKETEVITR